MKLLLVEDDVTLATLVKNQLEKTGFAVDVENDGASGCFQVAETAYDCVVLDINLPDMDGFEVCRRIRDQGILVPILMLTARNALEDRVEGLNIGADDYVSKPVDMVELIARVNALIRRSNKTPLPKLHVDDLIIEPASLQVERSGKKIDLNPKEFAVLVYLAQHSNEIVTRTMIMEHVWGSDFETLSNVVDVYIRYLRKKIDKPGLKPLLHTKRGQGYSLSDK